MAKIEHSSRELAKESFHIGNWNAGFRKRQTAAHFALLRFCEMQTRLILLNQSQKHFAHFILAIIGKSLGLLKGAFEKLVHAKNFSMIGKAQQYCNVW
jgi:hypothetical protein